MNKSKNTKYSTKEVGKRKSIIYNTIDNYKPTKIIYLIKYDEIQHIPTSSRQCIKNTYNLLTLEDLKEAKEYLETLYEFVIAPLIKNNNYKIILDTVAESQLKNSQDNIVYQRSIKMIGNCDCNITQSKFFTFTIEEINYKLCNR